MKPPIIKLLAALTVLLSGPSSELQAQQAKSFAITNIDPGDTLNIRSGPGMNFAIVAKLSNSTKGIQIRGEAVMNGGDDWVPISFSGGKGWTRSKYLIPAWEPSAPTQKLLGDARRKVEDDEKRSSTESPGASSAPKQKSNENAPVGAPSVEPFDPFKALLGSLPPKDLKLTVATEGGPPTEILTPAVIASATRDTSWMGPLRGRGSDTERGLEMGVVKNTVLAAKIVNEYVRTVQDEKTFFVECEVTIKTAWGKETNVSVPVRFIKRGVKWFSATGE